MKILWLLLPISVLWISFYILYEVMPNHPFVTWWSFPLLLTVTSCIAVSLFFAIKKIR